MKVIGLSGKMGTGKSTLAEELKKLTGFAKFAFADAVKQEVNKYIGVPLEYCYQHKSWIWLVDRSYVVDGVEYFPSEKYSMSVRDILQWWGTDVRRKQDPWYWTKQAQRKLHDLSDSGCPGVIIDDVRFEGEVRFIKDNGGLVVRVEPYDGWKPTPGAAANHESEIALDRYKDWAANLRPQFGELAREAEFIVKLFGLKET